MTTIALLLLAFTAGAVLHPVMASTAQRIAKYLHTRRVARAIDTVLSEGYGVTGLPADDTEPLGIADVERPSGNTPPLGFTQEGDWL